MNPFSSSQSEAYFTNLLVIMLMIGINCNILRFSCTACILILSFVPQPIDDPIPTGHISAIKPIPVGYFPTLGIEYLIFTDFLWLKIWYKSDSFRSKKCVKLNKNI